jgi:hypothetical protein
LCDGVVFDGTEFGVEFGVEFTVVLRGVVLETLELLGALLLGAELLGTLFETLVLLGAELFGTLLLGTLFETLELLGAELLGTELLDELESSEPRPCFAEAGLIKTAVEAARPTATTAAALNRRWVLLDVVVALVFIGAPWFSVSGFAHAIHLEASLVDPSIRPSS